MKEVINFIEKNIDKNSTLVLGISGGPDSMALLNIFLNLKEKLNLTLICAHINHNVREESIIEQEYLDKYCKENNIIFEYIKIDEWGTGNFEYEARKVRYEFFDKLINKYNAKYLLTAHHGDDLVETVLMRLLRGSTIKGYAGIERVIDNGKYLIIRPFLTITKQDIVDYCKQNNLVYFIDKTNLENVHKRNRFRNNILPLLKQEEKNVHLKFYDFSKQLLEYNDYINKVTKTELDKVFINNELNIELFNKIDLLIQKNIINNILYNIYLNDIDKITKQHVDMVFNLINSNKANTFISLPNIKLIKNYNTITIKKELEETNTYSCILNDEVVINDCVIKKINYTDSNNNYHTRLNSKDIKLPLYIRTRLDGDKIEVKNMSGTKKVKDIFIDSKIELNKRNTWPILVDSNNIVLWIPGIKKSKYDKKITDEYDIVLEYQI